MVLGSGPSNGMQKEFDVKTQHVTHFIAHRRILRSLSWSSFVNCVLVVPTCIQQDVFVMCNLRNHVYMWKKVKALISSDNFGHMEAYALEVVQSV